MDRIITYLPTEGGQPQQSPAPNAAQAVPAERYVVATTQQANEHWTLKETIVYGFLGLVGIGGSIWLGRKLVLDFRANTEEKHSFEDGSSATIAKQIKMAFENDGWWGTNMTALREALVTVESQEEWKKVITSYEKLYSEPTKKANLLKDLSDELQSTEYNEMMQIINAKPQKKGQAPALSQFRSWAKRLKAAFDKTEFGFASGTDEDAIKATLIEMPTQWAFIQTGVEYKKMYGTNIMDDMNGESEFGEYDEWMKIIFSKRKQ
ncbi:MAG: hypothetical protein ACJ77K_06420 [Bacteroidia bacterium]